MKTRRFEDADVAMMIALFRNTVHRVGALDYDQAQLHAWAPENIDEARWGKRFRESFTLLAEESGMLIGFANLDDSGEIDMLYVHADWQSQGVAKNLYQQLEQEAVRRRLNFITADVSITAQKFFLRQGFKIDRANIKVVDGVVFNNVLMAKSLVSLFNPD